MKVVLPFAMALPFMGIMAFIIFRPLQVLPRIDLAPGFAFTNQAGESLTNEDLRGKITLYTFTYTRCEEACASATTVMQDLQAKLPTWQKGVPLALVTITLAPEQDTDAQLAQYAKDMGANPEQWQIIRGDPIQTKQVVGNGFTTYYTTNEEGHIEFEPAFILVDGWGIMRAEYRTDAPELETIKRDIELVTSEALNSKGATRYAYEAAHLFLCYPR